MHRNVVDALLPRLEEKLAEHQVLIHAQKELLPLIDHAKSVEASEEDWGREYLDYEISVKTVKFGGRSHRTYQRLQHRPFRSHR